MKVLFFIRANSNKVNGGDLVQINLTAKYLRKAGITVDYSSDAKHDLAPYDVVHIFNSPRFDETKEFFIAAQNAKKPIAFSTIYWPKTEYVVGVSSNPLIKIALMTLGSKLTCWVFNRLVQVKDKLRPNHNRAIEKWLFTNANMLLPNSDGEMQQIRNYYHLKERAYRSVRNAVEFKKPLTKSVKHRAGVLSVGRIEPRKNTLKLIEACRELGLSLTLIGGYNDNDEYATNCLRKVKDYGFTHHPNMPAEELGGYYRAAEVHAIVSWYETPGLSTMEAAAAGCKIVSTNRGSTIEYFKDMVRYCDPFSYRSIKEALQVAVASEHDSGLEDMIAHDYTWKQTAQDTIEAYKELLS